MQIKYPLFKVFSSPEAGIALQAVLDSGFTGQGEVNAKFERTLQERLGIDYLATTNSATSAEHIAELLLRKPTVKWPGLKPNDEVLTTSLTCLAGNTPWYLAGLRLRWVDIDSTTLNLDLDDLARKVTKDTRVILLTHWGGFPVDLDRVKAIQDKAFEMYGVRPAVVEDCAHSLTSRYKGKLLGQHGNICTFSLQSIKHISSGDGGFITLPHRDLFKRAKLLRWYGIDRETDKISLRCDGDVEEIGGKWHMNDLASALGLSNFKYLDYITDKHRANGRFYDQALKNVKGITLLKREEGYDSANWMYSFLVEDRPSFIKAMKEQGIMANQVHDRNDKHSALAEFKSQLPTLDSVIDKVVAIPTGWWLEESDTQAIASAIKAGW